MKDLDRFYQNHFDYQSPTKATLETQKTTAQALKTDLARNDALLLDKFTSILQHSDFNTEEINNIKEEAIGYMVKQSIGRKDGASPAQKNKAIGKVYQALIEPQSNFMIKALEETYVENHYKMSAQESRDFMKKSFDFLDNQYQHVNPLERKNYKLSLSSAHYNILELELYHAQKDTSHPEKTEALSLERSKISEFLDKGALEQPQARELLNQHAAGIKDIFILKPESGLKKDFSDLKTVYLEQARESNPTTPEYTFARMADQYAEIYSYHYQRAAAFNATELLQAMEPVRKLIIDLCDRSMTIRVEKEGENAKNSFAYEDLKASKEYFERININSHREKAEDYQTYRQRLTRDLIQKDFDTLDVSKDIAEIEAQAIEDAQKYALIKQKCKQAYKKLAKKYHPDLNPNNKLAEERFKAINNAKDNIDTYYERQNKA